MFDDVWDIRIDLYIALGLLSENEGVEARNMDRPWLSDFIRIAFGPILGKGELPWSEGHVKNESLILHPALSKGTKLRIVKTRDEYLDTRLLKERW